MAATLIDDVPARIGSLERVLEYKAVVDNPGTPFDIYEPSDSANRVWILGYFQSNDAAANITFSTATKSRTLKLGAYQGVWDKPGLGYVFVGKPGEAVSFDASAALADVTIIVGEGSVFYGVNC